MTDLEQAAPFDPSALRRVLSPPPLRREGPPALSTSDAIRRAAVAAIFTAGPNDTELLFIQRATVDGDPWSGQMALPGGRAEPADLDSHHTAERETREEVGLDIIGAERLGSLTDVDGASGTTRAIVVSAHCFWLDSPPPLSPNREVAEAIWVPVAQLLDTKRYIEYLYPPSGSRFPGIQLDHPDQVIWGLTLRLLADLMSRLRHPFIR